MQLKYHTYSLISVFAFTFFLTKFGFAGYYLQDQQRQGILKGRVIDSQNQEPLPGANILLKGTTMGTISGKDGNFLLDRIPNGRYTVVISVIGYKPAVYDKVEIQPQQAAILAVQLVPTVIETPELIVTASKSIQRVQDSPISVAVVSDIEIRQKNSISIQDALRYTPGLYMTDDQVNIRGSTGFNKGAGSRVLVLLDGVPAIAGDTGGINWDALPPTEIAQIEVVKSAGSALYGSNALGGVINLITRDPVDKPVTRSRLSWGFYDQPYYPSWQFTDRTLQFNSIDVSHSRKIKNMGMVVALGRKTSTGYQENGHYLIWNAFGKFNYRISPQSHLVLLTNYTYNNHGNILTWKGPKTNDPLQINPQNVGDHIHSEKFITHLTYQTMVWRNLAFTSKSSLYRNNWQDYFNDQSNDHAKTYKLQQEFQFQYQPFSNHRLTSGTEFTYYTTTSSLFGNPHAYDIAAYAQDEFQYLPMFQFTLGARYDRHHVNDLFTEDQVSPKLGIVFQPAAFTAIRFSVGKGFRAASIAEIFTNTIVSGFRVIPNLNIRAESATSYEMGIHQIFSSNLIFDAAYFRNHYKNMIEPELDIDISSLDIQPRIQLDNLSETRIQGIELAAKTNFLQKHVLLNLSYTYLDAKRLGEIPTIFTLDNFSYKPSRTLAYRPRHLLQLTTNFRFQPVLVGVDYRYISRFDEVLAYVEEMRLDQRVMDAYIEFQATRDIKFSLRANNVMNYNYIEVEKNLAPIRNFVFTMNSSF